MRKTACFAWFVVPVILVSCSSAGTPVSGEPKDAGRGSGAGSSRGSRDSGDPDSTATSRACTPGEQTGCTCPGGGTGAQVCDPSGQGYGACTGCPGSSSGSGSGTGSRDDAGVHDATVPDATKEEAGCTVGALSCNGAQPQECTAAGTTHDVGLPCAGTQPVCLVGACVSCTPGTSVCSGSIPQTCSASGGWVSGSPCPTEEVCNGGGCVSGCIIGGTFYGSGTTASSGCEVCTPSSSTSGWTDVSGPAGCPTNQVCNAGGCVSGCNIGGTFYSSGTTSQPGTCQGCEPAASTSAWTSLPTGSICGTYVVGTRPEGVAFDGTNIWVANSGTNDVTKLLASTGGLVGTYSVGSGPTAILFDGTDIWVTNYDVDVTKLLASTGAVVGMYPVAALPTGIAFDGTNIWVANYTGEHYVTKLLASTGGLVGMYQAGGYPEGVAFDGTNIWVANSGTNDVTKLLASTGGLVGTYSVGSGPTAILFDGTDIWVTNSGSNNVMKVLPSTGAVVGTYGVGVDPDAMVYDGTNIWVTNGTDGTVTKLTASTGATLGTYTVGPGPAGISFDGANIWVTNSGSNTVMKIAD